MPFNCESVNLGVYASIATGTSQPLRNEAEAEKAAEAAARESVEKLAGAQATTYACAEPCDNPPWFRPNIQVLFKDAAPINYRWHGVMQPTVYVGFCVVFWSLDIKCSKPAPPDQPGEHQGGEAYFAGGFKFPKSVEIPGPERSKS